jgi:hypothetical protein
LFCLIPFCVLSAEVGFAFPFLFRCLPSAIQAHLGNKIGVISMT